MTDGFQSAADLFGNHRLIKGDPKGSKPLNERATLIAYFAEKVGKEPKVLAIRCAHYTLDQLYALKSSYNDRLQRNNKTTADKYWWYVTKTTPDAGSRF